VGHFGRKRGKEACNRDAWSEEIQRESGRLGAEQGLLTGLIFWGGRERMFRPTGSKKGDTGTRNGRDKPSQKKAEKRKVARGGSRAVQRENGKRARADLFRFINGENPSSNEEGRNCINL